MRIKKMFSALMAAVLISALFVMPVSAHGHHGHSSHHNQTSKAAVTAADTDCPVCTVDGCTETGKHMHDGHEYCGSIHKYRHHCHS
ncbi:MAG: hypothetical protein NC231_06900 [Bacillus sp. (in: Bacteria)]|nr:hypothetical protein [Bacillus sp. (in: firmicutes)]MCM1426398.1 hypothetical protein [Eubacterium sp.]